MKTRPRPLFFAGAFWLGLLGLACGPVACFGQALDLLFSEYVEGSASNKALEIFNGSGGEVALDVYEVALYSNGNTDANLTLRLASLQDSLADGAVLTLRSGGLSAMIPGDVYASGVVNFNGDDAVALLKNGVVIDVIGEIGVQENIFADTTLRRKSNVDSPVTLYDPAEWDGFDPDTFDDLGQHTFVGGGPPHPEPSEYPTALSAVVDREGVVSLTWIDSTGAARPDRYLVYVWTTSDPSLPTDGVGVAADTDFSDGAGVIVVNYGVQSAVFDSLSPDTDFEFRLIPFSNTGLASDYKTDAQPPAVSARTPALALKEGFDTFDFWTVVSLGAEPEWELGGSLAEANAFGATGPADDWLVSDLIRLSGVFGPVLRFDARQTFDDSQFDPALRVLVSSDYDGSGSAAAVQAARWTALDAPLLATAPSELRRTGGLSIEGFGDAVYLAFQYVSSGTENGSSEGWQIDNLVVYGTGQAPVVLSVAAEASTLVEGATGMGTVTLSREPDAYPLVVRIESSDTTELVVPASLSFDSSADGLSKSFAIVAVDDEVYDLDIPTAVTVSALGTTDASMSITVRNADSAPPLALSVSPVSAFENAGPQASTLTVTLPSEPLGGYPVTVVLRSSAISEATVPASLFFSASDNRVKSVSVAAVIDGVEDGNQSVTLGATSTAFSAGSTVIEIIDVDSSSESGVISLLIGPTSVQEGESATGTVLLSKAPANDLVVSLSSTDTSELTVPPSITVSADSTVATFSVMGVFDGVVDADQSASVIASARGWIGAQSPVAVRNVDQPLELGLSLSADSLDEGGSVTATVTLSEARQASVTVRVSSTDLGEISVPSSVTIPAGQTVATFPIEALLDEVIDGDVVVDILITAAGWAGSQGSLTVRNVDLEKTGSLVFSSATINEGDAVLFELVLSQPASGRLPVQFAPNDDLEMPTDLFVEKGQDRVFFSLSARSEDGFEGDELSVLNVAVSGYILPDYTFSILEADPRGILISPVEGRSWSRGDTIHFNLEVADPEGTLERVSFQIDGVEVASSEQSPYTARYTLPFEAALNQIVVSAVAIDSVSGAEVLASVTGAVVFSPPLSNRDFVEQSYLDITGNSVSDTMRSFYLSELDQGSSRESLVASILDSFEALPAINAIKTSLLVYDRFPTVDELYVDNLYEVTVGSGEVQDFIVVPPMVEVAELSGPVFYTTTNQVFSYPVGIRGIAHVLLHRKQEASLVFGGEVAELSHSQFFTRLWHNRHEVAPTAQQIVQSANRVLGYEALAATFGGDMDVGEFGRARFVEGLVLEETFEFGTDVVFGPPNTRLSEDAFFGLSRLSLWRQSGFSREAVRPERAESQAYVKWLLFHPTYWGRFGYAWLNSAQLSGAESWFTSEWFGTFTYTEETWPWAFHLDHGWIAAGSDDAQGVGAWWYDLKLGWLWSSSNAYSWVYQPREKSWLWYVEGSQNPRYFYDTKTEAWLEIE